MDATGEFQNQYIIPPHILRAIARSGDAPATMQAASTLATDDVIRTKRANTRAARPTSAQILAAPLAEHRSVYDAHGGSHLPGSSLRDESDAPCNDVAANEAYDGLGATWDLYYSVYGRNSIDGAGMPLRASVHYDAHYDNAFWNGHEMVFGDGDGRYFNRFTLSLDVIGHELTHGVTAHEAALYYAGEAGALNESISDVFGSLAKQYHLKQEAAIADWLIGAGLFTLIVHGMNGQPAALRSMKNPGTAYSDKVIGNDPQPAVYAHYVHTSDDNGGVHINSGIPNRAFCLAAIGIGGFAWERAGMIWYAALRDKSLSRNATFGEFAALTTSIAGSLYKDQKVQKVVEAAWRTVGVAV